MNLRHPFVGSKATQDITGLIWVSSAGDISSVVCVPVLMECCFFFKLDMDMVAFQITTICVDNNLQYSYQKSFYTSSATRRPSGQSRKMSKDWMWPLGNWDRKHRMLFKMLFFPTIHLRCTADSLPTWCLNIHNVHKMTFCPFHAFTSFPWTRPLAQLGRKQLWYNMIWSIIYVGDERVTHLYKI